MRNEVEISKVRPILVDFNLLDPAIPEIFYFKHDTGASLGIILLANPDVDHISDAFLVLS